MRVLWFANTPCNADEYFNKELKGNGGWLKSLDQSLQDRIDLHIAFHNGYNRCESFKYGKTNYYPIQIYENKLKKYLSIMKIDVLDEEFKNEYLKIIKKVKPDIIHIHGTENPFGCIIEEVDIPVVVSIQGNLTVYSHKYYSGIGKNYLKVAKSKKILYRNSFMSGYIRQLKMAKIEQKNLKKCQNIIGRTAWDRRIARVLAPDSKYYHGDEILRKEFYEHKWEPPKNEKIVIYTTNSNNFYKGFETICHSLKLLQDININIEWRVAGIKSNDLIVKVVKKKLGNMFPKKDLVLLGRISADEVVFQMKDANIYIMPSHIENSPNNLCEAMILGMPCIATYAGGTGSLLEDGKEGILIQDGDPWAMAGAIIEVMENYDKAIEYGKLARERALKRHDRERIVNDIVESYRNIMNSQPEEI